MNTGDNTHDRIARPEPRPRPALPRMHTENYLRTVSCNMAGKKKGNKCNEGDKSRDSTLNSTKNSSLNSSTSSLKVTERVFIREKVYEYGNLYPDLNKSGLTEDEFDSSSLEKTNESTDSIDSSQDSEYRPERSSSNSDGSFDPGTVTLDASKVHKNRNTRATENTDYFRNCVIAISFAFVSIIIWLRQETNEVTKTSFDLQSSITDLKSLFPSQDKNIWSNFGSGIADVRSGNHTPAIFLLLASHNETTNCLAERVAEIARSALDGTGDVMLTQKLENDIDEVFKVMEKQLRTTKVVVLLDILSFETEAMKAFHDICDQYESLVSEAVYLLTMEPCHWYNESANLVDCAEKQLTTTFSDKIRKDTLDALIVRLTNGAVLDIKAEEKLPCSTKRA